MLCCFQSLATRRFLLWYILLVSLIVLPLSFNVILGCNMLIVAPTLGQNQPFSKGFGFFASAVYDEETSNFLGCVDYSAYLKGIVDDSSFKWARVFAGFLGAFIILATVICLLVQCFNRHGKSCLWSIMKWSYLFAFLSQLASFAITGSQLCNEFEDQKSQCTLGSDGIISIMNGVLLFGMVIATFNSLPPRNPVFRCWHIRNESLDMDTDSEGDIENPPSQEDVDEESPVPDDGTCKPSVASISKRSMASKRSTGTRKISSEVSLFSRKSWLSLGPRNMTVKEKARKFDNKNLWPMNQLNPQWPINMSKPEKKESKASQENQPVRNWAAAGNSWEPQPKPIQTIPGVSIYRKEEKKVQEGKKFPPVAKAPVAEIQIDAADDETIASLEEIMSQSEKHAHVKSIAEAYLKQIRMRQEASGIPMNQPTKSKTSTAAAILKKKSKAPVVETVRSGSSSRSGSSMGSEGILAKKSKSKDENSEASSFLAEQMNQSVEKLAKSVILGKRGKRIEETKIGNTVKIIDEYPASPKGNKSSTGPGVVRVRTEYCPEGRKTVMAETRADGSRLITTLIDPLTMDEEIGL